MPAQAVLRGPDMAKQVDADVLERTNLDRLIRIHAVPVEPLAVSSMGLAYLRAQLEGHPRRGREVPN